MQYGILPFEKACRHCPGFAIRQSTPNATRERRTSLGIPELHLPIESRTEKLCAIVVEGDVVNSLRVPHERPQALSLVIDVPKLRVPRQRRST